MLPLLTSALLLTAGSVAVLPAPAQNTTLVSAYPSDLGAASCESGSISGDGRFAFFTTEERLLPSDTNSLVDLYCLDLITGNYELISYDLNARAAGEVLGYRFSSNGRFVAFTSETNSIVAGDWNGLRDVFLLDRATATMTWISIGLGGVPSDGASGTPSVSEDGQFVVFASNARNLVPNDTNRSTADIFLRHLPTSTTGIVSQTSTSEQGDGICAFPRISRDARYVVFTSKSTNYSPGDTGLHDDLFVKDLHTGELKCITVDRFGKVDTVDVYFFSIRADGLEVSFIAQDSAFVPVDTNGVPDVFVANLQSGAMELVSRAWTGAQSNGHAEYPSISADGRYVVYGSYASDLVGSDTNGVFDVFVHDRQTGITERVSVNSVGAEETSRSSLDYYGSKVSDDGRYVVFCSSSPFGAVPPPPREESAFLRDRGGLGLSSEGTIPGTVTLRITGAEPGATLVLLLGQRGPSVTGGGPCPGLPLHLLAPARARAIIADSMGQATVSFNLNESYSESWIQVVTPANCRTSNEVFVEKLEFLLSQSGNSNWCTAFGTAHVNVVNAAPSSNVSLLYGLPGATAWPGRHCAGMVLGLAAPGWLGTIPADASGTAEWVFNLPNSLCGMTLQAVSHDNCRLSNLLALR